MKAEQAERTLRLVRETILGLREVQRVAPDNDNISMAVISLANAVSLLDLFLTGSLATGKDSAARLQLILLFASKINPTATCLLSDGKTGLVLRWPTEEDPRVIYPVSRRKDSAGADIQRKWTRIDNESSESVEFPSEVKYGRA